ncbi:MAG: group 1 truncated hemoglobin [Polyangiaceae bacterium]|nr:group 1 truncated hemoglobin [Polyangiaceae bacterium]
MTDFERIGGEPALRAIIDEFVDRCFADVMIGYLFVRANRERVKRFEREHAAEHLGAQAEYGGRAMAEAHGKHRIMGGHFDRRATILREVLEAHDVPDDVRARWLAYHESLRALITSDAHGQCTPAPSATEPLDRG